MPNQDDFNRKQYSEYYGQYLESNTDGKIGGDTVDDRVSLFSKYVPAGRNVFEIGSGNHIALYPIILYNHDYE